MKMTATPTSPPSGKASTRRRCEPNGEHKKGYSSTTAVNKAFLIPSKKPPLNVIVSTSKEKDLSVNGLVVTSGGTHLVGDWVGAKNGEGKVIGELVGVVVIVVGTCIWGVCVPGTGDLVKGGNGLLVEGNNVLDVLLGVADGNTAKGDELNRVGTNVSVWLGTDTGTGDGLWYE